MIAPRPEPIRPSWIAVHDPERLAELARPEHNLAIWSRPADPALGLWLGAHARELMAFEGALPLRSEVLHPDDPLDPSGLVAGLPDEPLRERLAADIARLGRHFVKLLDVRPRAVRVTFGPVRDDQCRKFHVDWVRLRLVTTYVGPGTEWLPDAAVNRGAVGASAGCPSDANRAIVKDASAVRRAVAGEVLVMKGEAWPGQSGRACVHRSPPIVPADGGPPATRVMLVLTATAR